MTRFTRGGKCKPPSWPPVAGPALDATAARGNDSPSSVPSATPPIPAADVPKKWRRVIRWKFSTGREKCMPLSIPSERSSQQFLDNPRRLHAREPLVEALEFVGEAGVVEAHEVQ